MSSSADRQHDVTVLMQAAANGDTSVGDRLLPLVYDQLRRAAQQHLVGQRPDHTLSATALVHEAYLKLAGPREVPWAGRRHFYGAAAEAMRQILLDHAKARGRQKRGGDRHRRALDFRSVTDLAQRGNTEEIVALDDALRRLEGERPRVAQIVRLRFYAGLSIDATAEVLGVSPRTVDLDWAFARAWLYRRLASDSTMET